MKKIIIFILSMSIILTGCGKFSEKDAIKDLEKKINNRNYNLSGDLEIVNDENIYKYKVDVSYKKDDYYRVSFTNENNNHCQIILKNDSGVYVVTPALNKSFRFQSDWPYSNSQIYLLGSILNDIKSDSKRTYKKEKNKYIFTTTVNYPNNRKLVKQDIIFDKKMNLKMIKVYNEDNIAIMTMKFNKIDYKPTFKKNYFNLDSIVTASNNEEHEISTSEFEDSIYPLNLPDGTKLTNEEVINKTDGKRIIMTFEGEKPFLLVEETANKNSEMTVIPTNGEPYMLQDSFGVLSNNSLSFATGGIEYYLVSDVLNQDELISVAQSINVIPTMK